MGTNYYAHRIPSKTKKELIKALIDTDSFHDITEQVNNIYGEFNVDYGGNASGGIIHLGKASWGWKFLWNPNWYIVHHFHTEEEKEDDGKTISRFVDNPNTLYEVYPLTKEGIKNFIDQPDIEIYDEYGDRQNKEEFWDMAINWGCGKEDKGWDSKSYEEWERKEGHYYQPWKTIGELVDMIKEKGYSFTSDSQSDFYSDGLRFSTYTSFS